MNSVVEDMMSYYGSAGWTDIDYLKHYGIKRRSGRYPWGSGENPYQHSIDFIGRVEKLKKEKFAYTDSDGKTWTGYDAIAKSMGMTTAEFRKELGQARLDYTEHVRQDKDFTYVDENGKTYTGNTAIAKSLGLSTTDFRTEIGLARNERRALDVAHAKSLKEDGLNTSEIAREMGVNESTVRSWFNQESEGRMMEAQNTADFLKKQVDEKGMIEVGKGVNREINVSETTMDQALYILEREGYPVYERRVEQLTNPGKNTTITALCPPGTEHKALYDNLDDVHFINEYITRDGGTTYEKKFTYPSSLDSKRLKINYAEDGGVEKDGLIEIRPGCADLSLGESRFAQVRIMVDGTHYLKGMAVYSDDLPDGVDVVFNTNKHKGTPALGEKSNTVLKNIKKDDPENPFGSAIKDADQGGQYWYDSKTGAKWDPAHPVGEKKLGLVNKRADEGDWSEWKDSLPSQFLSKQPKSLASKQLKLAIVDKTAEYDDISSITNPTIKKYLLNKFADECDSASVHLQAAALPGQKYHVILPVPSMKDTEVYAPNYENGTKLALIRYPHGGTFEIPILTVNNKQKDAKKMIGTDATDAICINSKVAERLSGADFDGDTVMCIPTHSSNGVKIKSTDPLEGLVGFDPKAKYGPSTYEAGSVKIMTEKQKAIKMGEVSNLISDMTLAGASSDKLARAVRHSMVVIDAPKHELNWKQSEIDNDIASLKEEYQGGGGASTLISKAKGRYPVTKRQGSAIVNLKGSKNYDPSRPEGALLWKDADDAYYTKTKVNKRTGEVTTVTKRRTQDSTNMAETDDARTLVSKFNTDMELLYADYANKMKSMANQARKEAATTGKIEYKKEAKAKYAEEVNSLDARLNTALMNAPRERYAQIKGNAEKEKIVKEAKESGKTIDKSDLKKMSARLLTKYREEAQSVSRKKRNIKITDKEWEAIQAGAISESKLQKIMQNTDIDDLRDRATPKTRKTLSTAQQSRIKALRDSGKTVAQIAEIMGKSPSTISNYLNGKV